jgi:P-type Cu+ transporter
MKSKAMSPSSHKLHTQHSMPTPTPTPSTTSTSNPPSSLYTCPMHPKVLQNHRGFCPDCGMVLQAKMSTLEQTDQTELIRLKHRFVWTLPLTLLISLLAMAGPTLQWFDMPTQSWIELVLTLPLIFWAAWPFFQRARQSLVRSKPNMWTLIGLGISAAFLYSVVATVVPSIFPDSLSPWGGCR